MKQICIIADCIDDQYAGIYTYATELIREIEKNTPEDMCITYIHYKENDFFKEKNHIIIPMGRKFPGRSTLRKFFRLPWILKQKGFDLVHDLYHIAPFPFKNTPYKKVITIHDLTPVLFPEFHVPQGKIQHVILPLVIHNADAVITVSEHTKKDIERVYGRKNEVRAIPLAARKLDTSFIPEEERYILYVSTIEPRKNIEVLIQAFENIKEKGYTGKLLLIGKKGWKCEHVFEMMERSSWKEAILWKGYVESQELGGYFSHADAFVYPSLYEGFGLPVLEAMQYGIPVIAGDNSSVSEVIGEAGFLFPAKDVMALTSILEKILLSNESSEIRKEYAEKSLLRAQDFSWKKTATDTLKLYRDLLQM